MSHVEQVGAKLLWSVSKSLATEPFAYISQVGDTYRAEDVEDGSLGSCSTLAAALERVEEHAASAAAEEAAHTARVLAIIAAEERAA